MHEQQEQVFNFEDQMIDERSEASNILNAREGGNDNESDVS